MLWVLKRTVIMRWFLCAPRDFFAILVRDPRAFQIGANSVVNPLIGKFLQYTIMSFWSIRNKLAITHTFAIKKLKEK